MAGRAAPARLGFCTFYVVPSQRCAVSCRAVRLYVVINRVLPGAACAARVPTARNRARCTGRRDCPWFPASCMALRRTRARPAAGRKAYGQRGLPRGRLSHAAAGTATAPRRGVTCPAAMRASRIVDMVSAGWVRASTGCREKGPRPGVTPVTLTLVSAEPGRAGPGPAHGAVEPDRDERGDVRPSVGPDRGNPEQLGLVQRPAGLIPSGRHRLRIAEPLVQSGHWHAHRRTFPIASEPSAMSTRNPARNHRRAPDQPSEGCGRGEGRVSDGADGRGGFPLHRTGERVQHLPVVAAGCQLAEKTSNYLILAYG